MRVAVRLKFAGPSLRMQLIDAVNAAAATTVSYGPSRTRTARPFGLTQRESSLGGSFCDCVS